MSPDLTGTIIAVLKDWRVIFAALFFLLAAAVLRQVGLVLSRPKKRGLRGMRFPLPGARVPAAPVPKPASPKVEAGEDGDEDAEDDGGREAPARKKAPAK